MSEVKVFEVTEGDLTLLLVVLKQLIQHKEDYLKSVAEYTETVYKDWPTYPSDIKPLDLEVMVVHRQQLLYLNELYSRYEVLLRSTDE